MLAFFLNFRKFRGIKYIIPSLFIIFLNYNLQADELNSKLFIFSGGNGVGNGGDEIRNQFRAAKEILSHKIKNLQSCSLSPTTAPAIGKWILAEHSNLANDLLNSKHEWDLSEKPTCAFTQNVKEAPILLSFPTCIQTTHFPSAIEKLLVHESVHHFGITDENFADEVALTILNARLFPHCPNDLPLPFLKSGKWRTISMNSSGIQLSVLNQNVITTNLPWSRTPHNLKTAAVGVNICGLDDEGILCTTDSSGLAWKSQDMKTIGPVYGLFGSGGDALSICWVDLLGLSCISELVHLNGRFSQFQNVRDVAVGNTNICVLEEQKIYCKYGNSTSENTFSEITQLIHPRALASSINNSKMCALDDKGIRCWESFSENEPNLIEDVFWPEQIVTNADLTCVLDQQQIKCWPSFGPQKNKLQIVAQNVPSDTLISLEIRRLCLSSIQLGFQCMSY